MKIFITGDPGAGKTTMAKALGEKLNVPVFSIDEFMFISPTSLQPYDYFRKNVEQIIDANSRYIIEGIDLGDSLELFNKITGNADLVINFDVPTNLVMTGWFNRFYEHKEKGIPYNGFDTGGNYSDYVSLFKYWLEFYGDYLKTKEIRLKALTNNPKVLTIRNHSEVGETIKNLVSGKISF